MTKDICYLPTNLDKEVAQLDPQFADAGDEREGKYVSTLRGLYDSIYGEQDWDSMTAVEIAAKLGEFRGKLRTNQANTIRSKITNLGSAFSQLKRGIPSATTRNNRINMIVRDFSEQVTLIMSDNADLNYTRSGICNGIRVKDGIKFGAMHIFDNIFKHYCLDMQEAYANGNIETARKLAQVLENWEGLVTLARIKLRDTEGLILGGTMDYAVNAEDNNYNDEDLTNLFDMEESKREGWQEIAESVSAYASIGKEVRKAISTLIIPETDEDGNPLRDEEGNLIPKTDDLGTPIYMDPVKVHQYLMKVTRGSVSSIDMVRRITEASKSDPTLLPLVEVLSPKVFDIDSYDENNPNSGFVNWTTPDEALGYINREDQANREYRNSVLAEDPDAEANGEVASEDDLNMALARNKQIVTAASELRTKFYTDLRKDFNPLSVLEQTIENGLIKFKTIILNRINSSDATNTAISNLTYGRHVGGTPIYTAKGDIDWDGITDLNTVIETEFLSENEREECSKGIDHKTTDVSKPEISASNPDGTSISPFEFARKKEEERKNKVKDKRRIDNFKNPTRVSAILTLYRSLGITISTDTANRILSDNKSRAKVIAATLNLYDYFTHSNVLHRMNGTTLSLKEALTLKNDKNPSKDGVLLEAIKKLTMVSVANDSGLKVESRVPYVDKKGNPTTISSDVNPSYLGTKMADIAALAESGNIQALQKYLTDHFLSSPLFKIELKDGRRITANRWIRDLFDSNLSQENSFANMFSYKRFLGDDKASGAQRFEDYTQKKHALSLLMEFMGPRETEGIKGANYAYYPVFILGDSGVSKFIKAPIYSENTILEELYNVYQQELVRAQLAYEVTETLKVGGYSPIENFSDKWNQFTALPFLNKTFEIRLIEDKGKQVMKVFHKGTDTEVSEAEIRQAIALDFKNSYLAFGTLLRQQGILDTVKYGGGTTERYKYLENYAAPKGVSPKDANDIVERKKNLQANLRAFVFNTRFATIQQIQMFSIDPGFYKGVKDMQKRYKEIHAPGTVLDVKAWDKYNDCYYSETGEEVVLYFEDININAEDVNEDFMKAIENNFEGGKKSDVYKAYLRNTLTDGQGYRSLKSYRKVMGMAGKWTEDHETVYQAIQAIRAKGTLTEEDIANLQQLAMVFQPLKPYLYTHENVVANANNDIVKIPVQHKYAEIILIPELLPAGCKLRRLAELMDTNNVDMVGSTKVVKVGGFGACTFDHKTNKKGLYVDENGKVLPGKDEAGNIITDEASLTPKLQRNHPDFRPFSLEDLEVAFNKGYKHRLSYADYKIQTNVPEHINHAALFGTQVRKLIMTGLNMEDSHYADYLDGKQPLNGRRLLNFYNQLITANILESYHKFEEAIKSVDAVSLQLIQNVIANSRESQDNIIAYCLTEDHKFLVPLFEGNLEHDTAAALLSIFKKMVNKQQISGGAAVQASAWGITSVAEDNTSDYGGLQYHTDEAGTNVVYADCEIPFNLKYTYPDGKGKGKEIQLDFNKYCYPDGSLRMTEPAVYIDIRHHKVLKTDTEIEAARKAGTLAHQSLIEKQFPGILDIIAYRIPTESDYSMLNLRIKRFSKMEEGGTIKVPAQGTTQAGFDFDIDKLYLMRKEFKIKNLSKKDKAAIWAKWYNAHKDIKQRLEEAKSDYVLSLMSAAESGNTKAIDKLLTALFDSAGLEETFDQMEIQEKESVSEAEKKSLKSFWEAAGIEGTPEQALREFIEDNAIKYLEDYDLDAPVMTITDETGTKIKGNSRTARNNMLIHLMRQRLMDRETMQKRYTPGGFENAREAARTIRQIIFKNGINTSRAVEAVEGIWSRDAVAADTESIYLFGDNTDDRLNTHYIPTSTQAVIRGLPNAFGIDTKKNRGTNPDSYFTDADFEMFKKHVDEVIEAAKNTGKTIKIPSSNGSFTIGTGKAELDKRAPKCYDYLVRSLTSLAKTNKVTPFSSFNYADIKKKAETEKDPEPEYDYSDPRTMLIYNQQNQVAGKLIGIFANQNVNHAFASLMISYELRTPIAFGDHCGNNALSDLIHHPLASETCAEFLAASVDAVKDPVLNFLNLNTITADSGAILARLGYSSTEIGLLLSQPIIKELCEYSFNNGCSFEESLKHVKDAYKVAESTKVKSESDQERFGTARLAYNIAVKAAEDGATGTDAYKKNQLDILDLFCEVYATAQEISKFVTSTKFTAANSVKSTFGGMYAQQLKVLDYIKSLEGKTRTKMVIAPEFKSILSSGDIVSESVETPLTEDATNLSDYEYLRRMQNNPFAYEQAMFDVNTRALRALNKNFFPYDTPLYTKMRYVLNELSNFTLNDKTIDSAHQEFLMFILSYLPGSRFNPNTKIVTSTTSYHGAKTEEVTSEEYYNKYFVPKLFELLKNDPRLKDLPLFTQSDFTITETENVKREKVIDRQLIIKSIGLQSTQVNELIESWESLFFELGQTDPMYMELATDLYFYNFFRNGFKFGPTAFGNLAPARLRANITLGTTTDGRPVSYRTVLNEIQEGRMFTMGGDNSAIEDFTVQFIRNHAGESRFVTNFYKERAGYDEVKKIVHEGNKYKEVFTVTVNSDKHPLFRSKDGDTNYFKPAFMIDGILYIAVGGSLILNATDSANMTYRKYDPIVDRVAYNTESTTSGPVDFSEVFENENDLTTLTEYVEPKAPLIVSLEEETIINSMPEKIREYYENSSDERKREILEDLKKNPDCYFVNSEGQVEKLC